MNPLGELLREDQHSPQDSESDIPHRHQVDLLADHVFRYMRQWDAHLGMMSGSLLQLRKICEIIRAVTALLAVFFSVLLGMKHKV